MTAPETAMVFYPAILFKVQDGLYTLTLLDFPEINVSGSTMEECYQLASSALGKALIDVPDDKFPIPSSVDQLELGEQESLLIIQQELYKYRMSSKLMRKNVTIPEYLNSLALRHDINFSQFLTEALMKELL